MQCVAQQSNLVANWSSSSLLSPRCFRYFISTKGVTVGELISDDLEDPLDLPCFPKILA